jgi:transcriptional regulator with XRE-family HTH domain
MPRIAQPVSPQAVRAREELEAYLKRAGLSANALSKLCGVPQPTLNKFMRGKTKAITPRLRPALAYAKIKIVDGITTRQRPMDNVQLQRAINRAWDGRPETLDLLAKLIESLGPFLAAYKPVLESRGSR